MSQLRISLLGNGRKVLFSDEGKVVRQCVSELRLS